MVHSFDFFVKMFRKRPLRSGLTLLQIALGVATITVVLSFIFSVIFSPVFEKKDILYSMNYGEYFTVNDKIIATSGDFFTQKKIDYFNDNGHYIQQTTIVTYDYNGKIGYQGSTYTYSFMVGAGHEIFDMLNFELIEGNFFTKQDVENYSKLILISEQVKKRLFGDKEAVGKTITKRSSVLNLFGRYKVIGVYRLEEQSFFKKEIHFLVPYSTMYGKRRPLLPEAWVMFEKGQINKGKEELSMFVSQKKYGKTSYTPTYYNADKYNLVFTKLYMEDKNKMTMESFGSFLAGFALIAFVISFIGVLSMMMVSVVERTREIGLRRSLGARKLNIIGQVIMESTLISLIGGILGILLAYFSIKPIVDGMILQNVFANIDNLTATLSLESILITLGSVVVVGVLAGLYPALQAVKIIPVEAIRDR